MTEGAINIYYYDSTASSYDYFNRGCFLFNNEEDYRLVRHAIALPMLVGNGIINNERTMNNKKVDINCNYEINVTIFTAITNNTVV